MTDCSQLSAELADAQQQLDALPKNPIQYCEVNSDNLQEFKACLRDLRQQVFALDAQINALSNNLEICDALIGTWTVHSTNPIVNNNQFTITAWDTQGPLMATFTFYDGVPGTVIVSDYGVLTMSFPELYLTIAARPDIGAPNTMAYAAKLDSSTPSPQFKEGYVEGLKDSTTTSGVAEWTATKS